jgi:hypothetical protein
MLIILIGRACIGVVRALRLIPRLLLAAARWLELSALLFTGNWDLP